MQEVDCEKPADITFQSFAGAQRPQWTDDEKRRLCDADKLAGHLSEARVVREGAYPAWGGDADFGLMRDHIDVLLAAVGIDLLPRSHALRGALT
jgi:hypothetical protein